MDAAAYNALKVLQDHHWWFEGRRQVISALIERVFPQIRDCQILEAGCGYGGNIRTLSEFGQVECFEYDQQAREYAAGILGRPVHFGHLPDAPGFDGRKFDLVAMLDVLEHIEDDRGSLRALKKLMAEEGRILITVPALPWLWSQHDEIHHHKRRYTKRSLEKSLRAAGLAPVKIGYFNTLLFPLAVCQRMVQKLFGGNAAVDQLPPRPLNAVLKNIFGLERSVISRIEMPIGLSLFAVAEIQRD